MENIFEVSNAAAVAEGNALNGVEESITMPTFLCGYKRKRKPGILSHLSAEAQGFDHWFWL